jgi:hypothetical protein
LPSSRPKLSRARASTAAGARDRAEIVEEQIDAAQRQPPARVGSLVAGEGLDDAEHGVAVGAEERLGVLDALRTAVTFDLALVGVELEPPDAPVGEQRGGGAVQRRQHRTDQRPGSPGKRSRTCQSGSP